MTATDFLARLEGVKAAGQGRWTARCPCPAHARGDRRPSLSIAVGEKGVVLKCFTGCDTKDIVQQLGLSLSDLFREQPAGVSARGTKKSSSCEIVYSYNDEAGHLLFQVVRGPNKKFLQRRPDPANPG